jgi:hypothetical protein
MDSLQAFKEKAINNYISSVDMTDMDINTMKNELKVLIGEEPAIQLNYENEKMMNEDGSVDKRVSKLDSVTVTFTINKEFLPGKEMPFPISKTFIVG